jgi:pyruvate kinase
MLQTMIDNPSPTRAEASDVANAIFDGTDVVMLSGETAAGHYPKEAARMMESIIVEAEQASQYNRLTAAVPLNTREDAVVASGVKLAEKIGAHAIVIFTNSGNTAKLVSRQRPQVPVLVLAHDAMVQRQLTLWWGLDCMYTRRQPALEAVVNAAEKLLLQKKKISPGQTIVMLASSLGAAKPNFIKVHSVRQKQ